MTTEPSRRVFLGIVGAACAFGCAEQQEEVPDPEGPFAAGNVADAPIGTLSFVLGRDDAGIYAMTGVCTHTRCSMLADGSIDATGLYCSCHGSRFDRVGKVTKGPARRALKHYLVEVDGTGELTIQAGEVVDASTRLTV
jgi:Rieske Fe-S protein